VWSAIVGAPDRTCDDERDEDAMRQQGKVALVYVAASGIGAGSARALAADGATVVCADLDEVRGPEVVAGIVADGGAASFVACDFLSEESIAAAIAHTVELHGGIDTIVTSVGAPIRDWHKGVDLYLKGPYYASRHGLPELEKRGGGSLIHIGSISSIRGAPLAGDVDGTAYPSSKHGVYGLTKTLAIAYGPKGIRVNIVCPGYIKTELTRSLYEAPDSDRYVRETLRVPLGRWGEPEDIGNAVAFLSSDDSSFISGQAIVVDGGQTAR
jgi:NAD(P)-dependent dehydrogenase (short-subunit alcohol dehydrogenase family)